MEWGPDGETILTATTAPRLRIGNGFKVWHYSGALLHETVWAEGQELNQVLWQRFSDGVFTEKPISNVKVQGIQPSQPQSSKAVYVPPNIRSGGAPPSRAGGGVGHTPVERPLVPGLPIGYKVSQGQRKKERNAKRTEPQKTNAEVGNANTQPNAKPPNHANATQQQQQQPPSQGQNPSGNNNNRIQRQPRKAQMNNQNHTNASGSNNNQSNHSSSKHSNDSSPTNQNDVNNDGNVTGADNENQLDRPNRNRNRRSRNKSDSVVVSTGDPEKDKQIRQRIRTIQQKIRDIGKLKAKRDMGETIDGNQLSKINTENDLIKELNALKVGA